MSSANVDDNNMFKIVTRVVAIKSYIKYLMLVSLQANYVSFKLPYNRKFSFEQCFVSTAQMF